MTPLQLQRSATVLSFGSSRPRVIRAIAAQAQRTQQRCISIQQLDDSRNGRERIVILGSGWAGYTLSRALNHTRYQVIVVSPRSYFVFTPLLASTSVGTLEFRNALEPVRSRRNKTEFFQGWADAVDFSGKKLLIEEAVHDPTQGLALTGERNGAGAGEYAVKKGELVRREKGGMFEMGWDKLVVAVGCYSQTFGTKGVVENAFFLKDVGDARRIRNRMLACFETASLPTTTEEERRALLHFAVVGGGPTGIEFSAELHDLIKEDMARLYPDLVKYHKITVYDVAPQILSMFDKKLGQYAIDAFKRDGIEVHTSTHIEELRSGLPGRKPEDDHSSAFTLKVKEEGEVPVGMCIWSTGLMMNPFIQKALGGEIQASKQMLLPDQEGQPVYDAAKTHWKIQKHPRSGAIITNARLQPLLTGNEPTDPKQSTAAFKDVFALGDCASIEGTALPATAQVANQKAKWLAKRLNKGDIQRSKFTFKDLGVMAYIGNWNAIMQSGGQDISGFAAWVIWRGAYLAKTVSWRNRILIATYWCVNFLFGRDISRF